MQWEKWANWESLALPVHHSYSLHLNWCISDQHIQVIVGAAPLVPSAFTRNEGHPVGELPPLPVCCTEKAAWLM